MNKKTIYNLTTILFLLAIVLPNIVQVLDLESGYINNENRKHKSLPKFNLKDPITSVGKFKNYYLENFGLKTTLVNSYINIKSNVLIENPIPYRVAQGKKGWFFLGNNNNNVLNNSFGNDPFSKKKLTNIISYLGKLKKYFDSKNIAFYVVVPPDKNRVYQEYLPFKLDQNPTKLEILKPLLKSKTGIEIIDLSFPLLESKKEHKLYLKTDTHWNYYGAYVGYNYTMDIINNKFSIHKVGLDDFELNNKVFNRGDLTKMINLTIEEPSISIKKKIPSEAELILDSRQTVHYKNKNQTLKTLLYRDSFTNAWIPFFNESFGEIIYHRSYVIDKKEINIFKPDIVIFEIIERNITLISK